MDTHVFESRRRGRWTRPLDIHLLFRGEAFEFRLWIAGIAIMGVRSRPPPAPPPRVGLSGSRRMPVQAIPIATDHGHPRIYIAPSRPLDIHLLFPGEAFQI